MAIRVFEPHYQPFSEGVRESFEGLKAGAMRAAFDTADRGEAGADAVSELTLCEAVSNSSGDDHPSQRLVGSEPGSLGSVLRTSLGATSPRFLVVAAGWAGVRHVPDLISFENIDVVRCGRCRRAGHAIPRASALGTSATGSSRAPSRERDSRTIPKRLAQPTWEVVEQRDVYAGVDSRRSDCPDVSL